MILRRLGNKSQIADEIQKYFPQHRIYAEPFFGAGGMFFNKQKVKYNIVNDLDSDVFNLFQVVINRKDELIEAFKLMPVHYSLLKHWVKNKEEDEIKKALRFIFLSNFTFLGKQDTIAYGTENPKSIFINKIQPTFDLIKDVQFYSGDFRKFFSILRDRNNEDTFIYCDPPYLNTVDKYEMVEWIETDCSDLFDCLIETGCKFAYSEFDHPFILEQAEKRGLNVIVIGERQNLKNRRTEILVTNYRKPLSLFDGV
jgi:DNA adenine methylase